MSHLHHCSAQVSRLTHTQAGVLMWWVLLRYKVGVVCEGAPSAEGPGEAGLTPPPPIVTGSRQSLALPRFLPILATLRPSM